MNIDIKGKDAKRLSKMLYPVVTGFNLATIGKGKNQRLVFVRLEIKDVVAWKKQLKREESKAVSE